MNKVRTVLIGLGAVNIGLLKILREKKNEISQSYGLKVVVVGVADSSGIAIQQSGYDYDRLIDLKERGSKTSSLTGFRPSIPTEQITDHVDAEVLVEGSPVNLDTGNPGLAVIRGALRNGWSVVSANKAPLVLAFDELQRLAGGRKKALLYSAAVCGGLPVINVLQRDLRATKLIGLQGIFNATTNFILETLENGGTFDEAVKEAQRLGAAEADPSLDIDGYDSANKLFIIMKSFTDYSGKLADIRIEGIRHINFEILREAKARNSRIKLLATGEKKGNDWVLSVKPTEVEAGSFMGNCDGWEMGIQIHSDYYEEIAMKIRESDPVSTSAAVLRDIINAFGN